MNWQMFYSVLAFLCGVSTLMMLSSVPVSFELDGRAAGLRMTLATAGAGTLTALFLGLAVGAA